MTTSTSSSFSTSSSLSSYQVKTKLGDAKTNEQYYDITDISADELHLIKEQDPFLYYSIPTKVHQDPPRDRKRGSCTSLSSSSSDSSSSSSSLSSTEDRPFMQQQPTRRVSRKSCISVECHPDLLMDDILQNNVDLDDMDMDIARVDVEDPALAMLLSLGLEDLDDRLTSSSMGSYPNRIQ